MQLRQVAMLSLNASPVVIVPPVLRLAAVVGAHRVAAGSARQADGADPTPVSVTHGHGRQRHAQ